MTFQVGDRVEMNHPVWGRQAATVGRGEVTGLNGPTICVHFDDPEVERVQSYQSGWYASRFVKIDNEQSFIPEDWS